MSIKEILETHDDLYLNNQTNKFYCDCGLELGAKRKAYYVMDSTHRAHVAEVLDKHMQEREAAAVRETARYIERITPRGLVNRDDMLADLTVAELRISRGLHANGREKGQS